MGFTQENMSQEIFFRNCTWDLNNGNVDLSNKQLGKTTTISGPSNMRVRTNNSSDSDQPS
jgi:hypothetical protein